MSQWVGPPSQESILWYQHFFPRIFKLDILHRVPCTKCWTLAVWARFCDPSCLVLWHAPRHRNSTSDPMRAGSESVVDDDYSVTEPPVTVPPPGDTCSGSKCKVNLSGRRAACHCLISSEHSESSEADFSASAPDPNMILQTWRPLVSRKISSKMVFRSYK